MYLKNNNIIHVMCDRVKLPDNASNTQREIYNKNCLLLGLAIQNKNRYGVLISLCSDLGSQDYIDENRFLNVYPYCEMWYNLAYGKSFYKSNDA